jgi:hypothetical protein
MMALKIENFSLVCNLNEASSSSAHPSNGKAFESFVAGHGSAFFYQPIPQ